MKVWGVDGCPSGWFAVSSQGDLCLAPDFEALLQVADSGRLYVDVPIGLPDVERRLESLVRRRQSVRAGSLFSVPCRQAVYASSYQSACDINLAVTGKKLSKQSWFLCRKIREVDGFLRQQSHARRRVMESHPELAFGVLNRSVLKTSKKTRAGIEERLAILGRARPDARELFISAENSFPRRQLGRDDIVDAMVLMVVGLGRKQRLVVPSQNRDAHGIPIRMIVPLVL